MTAQQDQIEQFIADRRATGGSEPANTQLFLNGLTQLLGFDTPCRAKRAACVRPVLDPFAVIAPARRLNDRKYAA